MKKIVMLAMALPALVMGQLHKGLTLEQAVSTALKNNYGIVISNKNAGISETRNSWGAAGALPSITLSGSTVQSWDDNTSDDYTTHNYGSTVALNWVLFRGFGAYIDKSKLEEVEKLSKGNAAVVVEQTISNVILAYYGVLLQDENMKMAEKLMILSEDRYKSVKLKTELGSSVTYDLLQSRNSYLEDKSSYLSAKANYNNAVRQLNFLMAEPLETGYQFLTTFYADTSSFEKTVLMGRMLSENNMLKNQYISLELARLDVRSARSSFLPVVTASASAGYSDSETAHDINTLLNRSSSGVNTAVSVGVSLPLFDGGKKRQALKVANLEKEIAEVEVEEMRADLGNQLSQEYELYEVRREMLTLANENLEAAELNLTISQKKFDNGAINSFNFRDVQQIYLRAALNQHNAVYNVIQSFHSLLRLTGGLIGAYK